MVLEIRTAKCCLALGGLARLDAGLVGPDEFCMIKPHAFLSLLILLCAFGATRASAAVGSTWEYAQLTENGSTAAAPLHWRSRISNDLPPLPLKALVAAMKKSGEMDKHSIVEDLNQFLQYLGALGWELVQVETKRDAANGYNYRTYFFKRQTG